MKIADPKPPYCAACFGAVEGRYVDFEAAYDGPVIPGTPEPVPVDDLIICEHCLSAAFDILDPQGLKQTISQLEQIVVAQEKELEAKDKAINGAKVTITELVDNPIKPPPGKPPLVGVSDDVKEIITKRRFERRGTSSAPKNPKRKAAA